MEIEELIKKKSYWLANELGWDRISKENLGNGSNISNLTVITEPNLIEVPFEILMYKNTFIGDTIKITRKLILDLVPPSNKKGNSAFFIFDDKSNLNITESTIREEQEIKKLSNKNKFISMKTSVLKSTRFKEELATCKYFHFAGHLEKEKFQFNEAVTIQSNEIQKWNLSNIDIAYLNGCNGLSSSQSMHSLGVAFIIAGVKSIAGFTYSIPTEEAERTGIRFWKSYFETRSVEKSILSCKQQLKKLESPFRFTLINFGIPIQEDKKHKKILNSFNVITIIATLFILLYQAFKREEPKTVIDEVTPKIQATEAISTKQSKIVKKQKHDKKVSSVKVEENIRLELYEKFASTQKSNHPLESEINLIQSPSLKKEVNLFLNAEHPIYSFEEKIKVIKSILTKNINEANKEALIKNERSF
ncbi:CHAT domain-containing protein [Leptospira levettii]|uniref:CHAT domain-containing protein n=1 Tax=Leptospira levettii TaxID=2023178 RepID=UPI00223E8DD4|nr:CHAT domain-containing protein [Leptospira levettii]MCW7498471.1 CHAT domain-containing protein [Leptospira levettii]